MGRLLKGIVGEGGIVEGRSYGGVGETIEGYCVMLHFMDFYRTIWEGDLESRLIIYSIIFISFVFEIFGYIILIEKGHLAIFLGFTISVILYLRRFIFMIGC